MPTVLKRKRGWGTQHTTQSVTHVERNVHDGMEGSSHENGSDEDGDEDSTNHKADKDDDGTRTHFRTLPSASELRSMNEAVNLYKSNIFKSQLDSLLGYIRPNAPHLPPLERTLQKLHTYLTSLPPIPPVHPLEAPNMLPTLGSGSKRVCPSVAIPYPHPTPLHSTAWMVAFEPPAVMNVIGSWSDDLAVRKPGHPHFCVDVLVEMPVKLFQEKDYRNSRFFYKRAFYVACLAASLAQSFLNIDVHYESANGDVRRTCLLLTCRTGEDSEHDFTKSHAAIRIIPVLPDAAHIPIHRLAPSNANVHWASTPQIQTAPSNEPQLPTPLYNNTLALCFARSSRTRLVRAHKLVGAAPSFGDGLALLRVWANQRGFIAGAESKSTSGPGCYCVCGFEGLGAWWACVLEVLIFGEEFVDVGKKAKVQLVGKGLSSYQLFRAALDFFSTQDFETEPIFMKLTERAHKYNPEQWTSHHEAVFIDASGMVNILAGVPISSLQLLRHDARTTLKMLDSTADSFASVFLKDFREPHARFDAVIRINLSFVPSQTPRDFPSSEAAILHSLISTVRKALNTRAHLVVALHPQSTSRPLDAAHPAPLPVLTLGVVFDPEHATRLVDHGPSASTPEVDVFKAFWGTKAELRRFKDGRILESCVWDEGVARAEDREGIPAHVVRYILNLHFGIPKEHMRVLAEDYGAMLVQPVVRGRTIGGYKDALAAYEKFVKELKGLEDKGHAPLALVATKSCSPSLRYTAVFPPSSLSAPCHPSTAYLPAFDVVLQLERSSRWPDDLRAIQKTKLALLEDMARGLVERNGPSCQACVVLDDKASEIEDGCALEVVLGGWAFHARIAHDREMTLLQEMKTTAAEYHVAERALRTHSRRFVHAPAHHNAIVALHHKFPAFTYTVRLVKRWFGAHWLSARISDEAVELMCARVFLVDGDVPATGKRGFVRVILWLKGWSGSVYVPLYEAVKGEDVNPDDSEMKAGKGGWRIMTMEDRAGMMWVENVSTVVAARVRSIAEATVRCFEEGTPTFASLFDHPTGDYDFIIELDPNTVTRYWHGIRASPAVWTPSAHENHTKDRSEPVRVAFNPAELFFQDLQIVYGDVMELFYDVHGGTKIGGVWNPSVVGPERRAWKVFLGFSSLPIAPDAPQKGKQNVTFNKGGILAEMERMGEGLVTQISLQC